MLKHFYENPASKIDPYTGEPLLIKVTDEDLQNHFEDFYEEVFTQLSLYGEIVEMHVMENLCDHLIGNVYVMFRTEQEAVDAQRAIHGRFYAGRAIHAEFSPIVNFVDSLCQVYQQKTCKRGAFCNFMHIKHPSKRLLKDLYDEMYMRMDKKYGPGHWKNYKEHSSESKSRRRDSYGGRNKGSYSDSRRYHSSRSRYSDSGGRRYRSGPSSKPLPSSSSNSKYNSNRYSHSSYGPRH